MADKIKLSELAESIERHGVTPMLDEDSVFLLIEIARTALELSAAGASFDHADKLRRASGEPRSLAHRQLELAAIRAEEVHLAALAKVEL